MAQRTVVTLLDDLDGSEATSTVAFAFDGKNYSIDLNDEHLAEFEAAVAPYVKVARRTGGSAPTTRRRRSGGGDGPSPDVIREWAKSAGHTVSERGRISAEVRKAYDEAH